MNNLDLFADAGVHEAGGRQQIELPDASLEYLPSLFSQSESDDYLDALLMQIEWQQERIKMYGKTMDVPRLSAWYGDPGLSYTYSGITAHAIAWNQSLLEIKQRVEQAVGSQFNSVLVNLYRDGNDSVAWHSDDEPELGERPLIASISFGAVRPFCLRRRDDHKQQLRLSLAHGSCLIMAGPTQRFWQHQIAKTKHLIDARVNLTFRQILV